MTDKPKIQPLRFPTGGVPRSLAEIEKDLDDSSKPRIEHVRDAAINPDNNSANNVASYVSKDVAENVPDKKRSKKASGAASQSPPADEMPSMRDYFLAQLARPIPPPPARRKVPRDLMAIRVRTEIKERFDILCEMYRREGLDIDRQDLLDLALTDLFAKVVAAGGEIDI